MDNNYLHTFANERPNAADKSEEGNQRQRNPCTGCPKLNDPVIKSSIDKSIVQKIVKFYAEHNEGMGMFFF